jgi:hypothetical protein
MVRAGALPFKAQPTGEVALDAEQLLDEAMSQALALHAGETTWIHRDLVADLYTWFVRFGEAFFANRLPPAIISVERTNRRNLGWYKPSRDGLALRYRINLNVQFAYRDPADRLETLLHEMLHLEQDIDGKFKARRRRYHDKAFQARSLALGIPTSSGGCSLGIIPDGPFAEILAKHGVAIVKPLDAAPAAPLAAASRASSVSWSCGCTKAWVARGRIMNATCDACGRKFARTSPRSLT